MAKLISFMALPPLLASSPPKIPQTHIRHDSIAEMKAGEIGYTMEWAVIIQPDGTGTINSSYPVIHEPEGTANLRIKRVAGGVEVWADGHTWRQSKTASTWADMPILAWH